MGMVKRWFLSRRVTLGIVGALLALIFVASFVPQRGITTGETLDKWRQTHRAVLPFVDLLGLDHLYSTPVFTLLSLLALIALALSSLDQGKRAFSKTFRSSPPEGEGTIVAAGGELPVTVLARHGYRPMDGGETRRFVKGAWGYWGNFLLHLGMSVTVAASLFIALTYQRSILILYEGVPHRSETGWEAEEHGLLAQPLRFPYELRLDGLRREFTATGAITRMASELTLRDQAGRSEKLTVPLNTIVDHDGVRVYQSINYGDLFVVDFTGPDGAMHFVPLPLYQPNDLGDTSYRDFRFPWLPHLLSTHYEADVYRRSMESGNRLLALRLTENGREAGKVYLLSGEEGPLGPYRVKLQGVGTWTTIVFVRIIGMPLIFFGFFILVAGMAIHYVIPPREFGVRAVPGGWRITWQSTRFADFYGEEYAKIIKELKGESP